MKMFFVLFISIFFCQSNNINKEIKQARAFERANMLNEAMQIYTDIINTNPNNIQAIKRIKSIFRSNQDTTSIKNILIKYQNKTIKDPILLIELMELNIWANNPSWSQIGSEIYTSYNDNQKIISLLLGKIINNGLIDYAIKYIERHRVKIDGFYSLELGNYYTSRMQYENAMVEYLLHLKYNPQN